MAEPARLIVRWSDVEERCDAIADHWRHDGGILGVYGPPRGGCVPAALVAQLLDVPVLDEPVRSCLVVDDLIDSGATLQPYVDVGTRTDAMFRKRWSPRIAPSALDVDDAWIVLPWEHNEVAERDAAMRVLQAVGADTTRADIDAAVSQLLELAAQLAGRAPGPS